jgi:hypothetical protein
VIERDYNHVGTNVFTIVCKDLEEDVIVEVEYELLDNQTPVKVLDIPDGSVLNGNEYLVTYDLHDYFSDDVFSW